jgi:CDGSH-type Zn-finger protein
MSEPLNTSDPVNAPPAGVVIKVRKNGSLLVTGDFQLIDHEGREIPRPVGKPNVSLCRCGHSARKPFCDSAHKHCGFVDPPDVPGEGVSGGTTPPSTTPPAA